MRDTMEQLIDDYDELETKFDQLKVKNERLIKLINEALVYAKDIKLSCCRRRLELALKGE